MMPRLVRSIFYPLVTLVLTAGAATAAEGARDAIRPAPTWRDIIRPPSEPAAPQRGTTTERRPPAKGVLPDPVLLDGSNHPPEKRSEYGMLGEFEMPGDEDARNEAGGAGQQNQQAGGAQQEQLEQQQQQGQMAQSGGGPEIEQLEEQQQQQGGGGAGGGDQVQQIPPAGGTSGGIGEGDPNAQAQGMQVAELKTDPEAGPGGEASANQKPSQVAMGDSAMQIKPMENAPNVVGTQQAGQTQQHEKKTGTSGRPPVGSNVNRGAEKGRTMPAGL